MGKKEQDWDNERNATGHYASGETASSLTLLGVIIVQSFRRKTSLSWEIPAEGSQGAALWCLQGTFKYGKMSIGIVQVLGCRIDEWAFIANFVKTKLGGRWKEWESEKTSGQPPGLQSCPKLGCGVEVGVPQDRHAQPQSSSPPTPAGQLTCEQSL